jgi:hypothetical protein
VLDHLLTELLLLLLLLLLLCCMPLATGEQRPGCHQAEG